MNSIEKTPLILERSSPEPMGAGHDSHESAARPTRLGRLGLVILILIVLGVLAGYIPRAHQRTALVEQTKDLAIPTVSVTSPTLAKPETTLILPGEVRAFMDSPIYARANGYLKRWLVDMGAEVKEGDLLAEIDVPELNQELAEGKAQVAQAEAALGLAKTTAVRWSELYKTSVVSEQESNEKQADLALKEANIEAARANVRRLEDLQSFTKVTAPFAGTITARRADIGELIRTESGKELFHLAQTHTLRVYVHVPQSISRGVNIGQIAEVFLADLPKQNFQAKVVRTSGAMTASSRTLLTELALPNEDGKVLAGSFAQVRFPNIAASGTFTVPSNAVLFRSEGTQLAFLENDTVELRKVALGRDFGSAIEVLSGAEQNDLIVLNPPDSIISGMKVRVAK